MSDILHFPFLAIVGQEEMKRALILAVINPAIGGVLLIGPRGTGKSTAVRGLVAVMPPVRRSRCPHGCTPEAAHALGIDAICPDCARKIGMGEDITYEDRMRVIELPLNARLEDVVGGINERVALEQQRVLLEPGILSYAHQNLLYIDEVNLLDDTIINAILDAAALGHYTVRRGPLAGTFPSRFVLVGSMNPEEGTLRPQIMDRFGLRVVVTGLRSPEDRLEVYRRVRAFIADSHEFVARWGVETAELAREVAEARTLLPQVSLSSEAEALGIRLVEALEIDSHRAEYVLFEAARAQAAADGRTQVTVDDVLATAPMTLRQRQSRFMIRYLREAEEEEQHLRSLMQEVAHERKK